jgi:hypothetical protein
MIRVNQATEGREGVAHMGNIKVAFVIDPGSEQMRVGDEVADAALDVLRRFLVRFRKRANIGIGEIFPFGEGHQFIREVFVKNEPEDVVLVFVGLDFRPHLVGGFPDFGGELLFVHGGNVLNFVEVTVVDERPVWPVFDFRFEVIYIARSCPRLHGW